MNLFLAMLCSYVIGSMDWLVCVELLLCFLVWVIVVTPLTRNPQ